MSAATSPKPKTRFVTTKAGTKEKKSVPQRTPSEEILAREIADGITLDNFEKFKPASIEEFDFVEEEEKPKPRSNKKNRNLKRSQSVGAASNKNAIRKLDESLLDLPPATGRNRERTFSEGYDKHGALRKFKET